MAKGDERNVFLMGAFAGILGGLVVGSVAALEMQGTVRRLAHGLLRKLFGQDQSVRFELLGQ